MPFTMNNTSDALGTLSPMTIVTIAVVLLLGAVVVTRNFSSISRWFCASSRRLLVLQILALIFGLFGFVMLGRAALIPWSFDQVALIIGGLTVLVAGRIAADQLARKKKQIKQAALEKEDAAGSYRPPS